MPVTASVGIGGGGQRAITATPPPPPCTAGLRRAFEDVAHQLLRLGQSVVEQDALVEQRHDEREAHVGGRGAKIHLVTNGRGRVLAFTVTAGQMGDLRPAHGLLANLPPPDRLLADTPYDSNGLCHFLLNRSTTPVIPNNPIRKIKHPFDEHAYKARNIIERTIGRLKD